MEPLNPKLFALQTLVPKIQELFESADHLVGVLSDMVRECDSNDELNRRRQWIVDAKSNIERYRNSLLQATVSRNVSFLSSAAGSLFGAYRYISDDGPLSSRHYEEMMKAAGDVNDVARRVYGMIDEFDPANSAAITAELQGFSVRSK